ncbi:MULTISPECIES: bifunctional acetate--CoA ligase family protein/GNAT family N-acetyltransferase [unclassified Massilia]|uniref:bifunctional acetate--CoA ligase family protein/GNAT family N-acetyltransferase n=1 Tax=unclassified Massilia TaxID=2609279 RepID=UPI001B82D84E|nr:MULTISPECIES: bifunctional acetate--CoA ligase family protein/GNAT family N-acetyltransferase [unclassified Massilia]MBQ5939792.1 acetate--CoA ligase family protein [Massilia sp. AB1]MBQ5963073.1 acetate--CoA ligase family protein [Massilia sp. ZL223]
MSVRNLERLFAPRSVALIGASERVGSLGATLLNNLQEGGFRGQLYPVNPKYEQLAGRRCYASVSELPAAPDLAVICTPPATVPQLVRQLGELGTRAAIILSAGLAQAKDLRGRSLRQAALDAAHPYLLRLLGPNSAGLLAPALGLNASVAHSGALPGRIAFVSQSGSLMTGVLDWARTRGIGFSRFIALGDSSDVDLGDTLDYLASDGGTSAILLYVENLRYARKFMSAARAAARSKPVLVLKARRELTENGSARAAASESGALASADEVFDAAIRRAGMLRVYTTEQLFAAVETLAYAKPLHGERLVIVSNGAGPGVLALDALAYGGGVAAALGEETVARLDALLPAGWGKGNPVNLFGGAPPERYKQALEILLQDPQTDAVLVVHSPTATVDSRAVAEAIAPVASAASRTVLSCWLGGASVAEARTIAAGARMPAYRTPEDAVAGFLQLVNYRRNQNLLMEVPPSMTGTVAPDRAAARALVREALAGGRYLLSDPETKAILRNYGMALVETRAARDAEEAVASARALGFPVAVKILTPDVMHKSDFGGVALDLDSEEAVRAAALRMRRRLGEVFPKARFEGYSVQTMCRRSHAHELIVGAALDAVFGPVIVFGQGGVAVEVTGDHAVGLPPLNLVLARDLVDRTRVARLLAGYRNRPPANLDAILAALVQVSRMVSDIPEIAELDINPLIVDSNGAVVLDARMRLAMADRSGSTLDRLAIRPYPRELEETIEWQGQKLLLRPIRPEDGPAHLAFFDALTPDDIRYRMFVRIRELQPSQLARFTQIDYDREMAFIATRPNAEGVPETLAVGRVVADPDNISAEFAVTVRSDLKGMGLGRIMMEKLIAYCRVRGTREIVGEALPQNSRIVAMVKKLGFEVKIGEEGIRQMRLPLR